MHPYEWESKSQSYPTLCTCLNTLDILRNSIQNIFKIFKTVGISCSYGLRRSFPCALSTFECVGLLSWYDSDTCRYNILLKCCYLISLLMRGYVFSMSCNNGLMGLWFALDLENRSILISLNGMRGIPLVHIIGEKWGKFPQMHISYMRNRVIWTVHEAC